MKEAIKKYVPGAQFLWRKIYAFYRRQKSKKTKQIFTEKYSRKGWGSEESVSGYGSELRQTDKILKELPAVFEKYQVKSMLDIPCGDFNWMKHMQYQFTQYIGADIVDELIEINNKRYAEYGTFQVLNLLKDPLPKVDLIFCRDCLVHFSYRDINLAIANIKKSGAKYLMTTTFNQHQNRDILTGDWRQLNLEAPPFNFPKPLEIVNEGSTELGHKGDKSLGLWLIKDL